MLVIIFNIKLKFKYLFKFLFFKNLSKLNCLIFPKSSLFIHLLIISDNIPKKKKKQLFSQKFFVFLIIFIKETLKSQFNINKLEKRKIHNFNMGYYKKKYYKLCIKFNQMKISILIIICLSLKRNGINIVLNFIK